MARCYVQTRLNALMAYNGADRWKRVETVRKALFDSATKKDDLAQLGQGLIRPNAAVQLAPVAAADRSLIQRESITISSQILSLTLEAAHSCFTDSNGVSVILEIGLRMELESSVRFRPSLEEQLEGNLSDANRTMHVRNLPKGSRATGCPGGGWRVCLVDALSSSL